MTFPAQIVGALTLAGGLVAASAFVAPRYYAPTPPNSASLPSAPARAEDETVFYRDPMGGDDLSRGPKKDGMGMDYLPVRRSEIAPLLAKMPAVPAQSKEEPLFYRDAMGGADLSLTPKKDGMGMDYLPVRSADLRELLPQIGGREAPPPAKRAAAASGAKRILYYRNPMGLPDTSPVPKKDPMGMDYLPVYAGEEEDGAALKLALGKIQRSGVRSEAVQRQPIASKIRVPGSIQLDERRVAIVATRSEAFIEKVADVTTGDIVSKGRPLMRLYSPAVAAAAADYLVVTTTPSVSGPSTLEGARRRMENLAVPAELYSEITRNRKVPSSFTWPSPRDGVVLERHVVDGMRAEAGQTLFRIADLSVVWALVDVAEHDYSRLRLGQPVTLRARGLPDKTFSGQVAVIYPQINKETRTTRVRIELANPGLVLRPDMYVDAEIAAGDAAKVAAAPESAVIDTGTRQLVILDKGEGRFEPREVKTGRRGDGLVEIREGVKEGENVVVAANFLIDAESNLKSALSGMRPAEDSK